MIDATHQSTLNMFLRCGEQGRRRYLEGEMIPPGIAAVRGTGVHTANDVNLSQKIVTKSDMPLDVLQDAARDTYVTIVRDKGIYLPKSKESEKKRLLNQGLNETVRATKIYREDVAPNIHPIAVEQKFHVEIPGLALPLEGTMDFEEAPRIGDLKTSSRAWNKNRPFQEIQPHFYSLAYFVEKGTVPEWVYDVLITAKEKNDHQRLPLRSERKDFSALISKVLLFEKMLTTGVFPPANPTAWWCSPDWCGYYNTCPYVGNGRAVKWV